MAQAEVPFSLIFVTVGPLVLTIAMSFVLDPLADVAVSAHAFPHAIPVLDPVDPLSIIGVAVSPRV